MKIAILLLTFVTVAWANPRPRGPSQGLAPPPRYEPEPQGYSYPKPTTTTTTTRRPPPPPPPPRITTTTTTTRRPPPPPTYLPPYERVTESDAQPVVPAAEHEAGEPYDFTYSVKEDEFANDYNRNEKYDGNRVDGEYRTLLPDGRMQIVRYTADWKNGYNADITYEGEARYD